MRTLSARILLGFAALAVAFGAITIFFVRNLASVEDEIHGIRQGYLPLVPKSKDLVRLKEDLKTYVEEGFQQETNPYKANITLRTARERRNDSFLKLKNSADVVIFGVAVEQSLLPNVDRLAAAIDGLKGSYEELYTRLRKGDALDGASVTTPLHAIAEGERRIYQQANELANQLDHIVTKRMTHLEDREHLIQYLTIILGLVALGSRS